MKKGSGMGNSIRCVPYWNFVKVDVVWKTFDLFFVLLVCFHFRKYLSAFIFVIMGRMAKSQYED